MERSKLIRLLLLAALATAALGALAAFGFVKSGIYDAGASSPHSKFTEWLTHETMIHSVRRHAKGVAAPRGFTAAQVRSGFCAYETHCVACHGAAAVARQAWTGGLEPQPPYLLDVSQRFSERQLFWIVRNGIKMTAMPAWRGSLSDPQIWDIVAWLEASRQLPPQTYVRWRSARPCGESIGLPASGSSPIHRRAPAPPTAATGG